MSQLIDSVVEMEWQMFSTVNGEERVSCQEDKETFLIMRKGQYEAWPEAAVESYLEDLKAAVSAGRNLAREKYIRMMASTDKEGYKAFCGELPEVSPEKQALAEEIWSHMLEETQEMRKDYPLLALGGRPLCRKEEDGWASVESYQNSEMLTYSEKTLGLLRDYILELEADGGSLAYNIQLCTVKGLGYESLRAAEDSMTKTLYWPDGPDYQSRGCACRKEY